MQLLFSLFSFDRLALLMSLLVSGIGAIVFRYSQTYMRCSKAYYQFLAQLGSTIGSVLILVCSDNIMLFWLAWVSSNRLLTKLMGYNNSWQAAQNASQLTARLFTVGYLCLGTGFLLLYTQTKTVSITQLVAMNPSGIAVTVALIFLCITALIQSAQVPFERWLLSSLNSPTPVSAFMHAGLVNGGGFLLTRFAPLLFKQPLFLKILFSIGILSALIGTTYKLVQSSIKSMLASSTVGQMGFMIAQCGLGLFPAAIAHLFWHGCFKAYLFLNSGSALTKTPPLQSKTPSLTRFIMALLCGASSSFMFTKMLGLPWVEYNTHLVLTIVVFIAGTQLALTFFDGKHLYRFPLLFLINSFIGGIYGLSIAAIESFLAPLNLSNPLPLTPLYSLGIIFLVMPWLIMVFGKQLQNTQWFGKFYIKILTASQPWESTTTPSSNDYYD